MINLFYLSKNKTGGWVTFTSHLCRSLNAQGVEFTLWKIGNRTERFDRKFGYGLRYRNISLADAVSHKGVKLIVACAKNFREAAKELLDSGAKIVVHDPTETGKLLRAEELRNPWVIRRANCTLVGGTFIRHPYIRTGECDTQEDRRELPCVSTSRIDFDKHTDIILRANRLGADIKIYGFENRLYTKFKIQPEFPEWKQSVSAYPREHDAAFQILRGSLAMVDMSEIKGDGGGTQYTTLEAWDAGAIPIINERWVRKETGGLRRDDMKPNENCLVAGNAEDLVGKIEFLREVKHGAEALRDSGYRQLKKHRPSVVVPKVMRWLGENS